MNGKPALRTLCLILSTLLLGPAAAAAQTVINFSYSPAATTRFPLPFPSGSVATTFTSYTGSAFPYAMGTFQVGSAGNYSVAVGGVSSGVGVFVIQGVFAPSSGSDPSTSLANVLAGTQAPATIPSIALQAGVQYTYLVVLSSGSGTGTVTIDGGCVVTGTGVAYGGTCLPAGVTPGSLTPITVGVPLTVTLTATAGIAPHSYAVSAGTLPAGLTLDGSTGELSGTATAAGPFSFTITATDAISGTNVQAYSGFVVAAVPSMPVLAFIALALMLAVFGYLRLKAAA